MKKTWKIAIVLTFAFCLVLALIACDNEDGFVYVYETDEAGETVTDTEGNPVVQTDDEGNAVTAPDEDGDGVADDDEGGSSDEGGSGSIGAAGANTETGWGKIITPN